ncbi:MAG: hypothetical protein M1445_06050 [Bacteroidetes bacterium]|nr:hypothetical protein [Bacteroidota bacterium]MCL6102105.1 hypothetical protein [Bacteroidota bacterium]
MRLRFTSIAILIFGMVFCLAAQTSTSAYKIVNKIRLPGDGGWDYLSVDETGGRLFVSHGNATTLKVEKSWSIAPGEEPSGLALDNVNHRLFSVCSNKLMVVSDAETGKIIAQLPIGDRCDGTAFDPGSKKRPALKPNSFTILEVQCLK